MGGWSLSLTNASHESAAALLVNDLLLVRQVLAKSGNDTSRESC